MEHSKVKMALCLKKRKGKVTCLPSVTRFRSKPVFNWPSIPHYYSDRATHCTWPGFEPGPLSLEESALLTELMRPDVGVLFIIWVNMSKNTIFKILENNDWTKSLDINHE